MLARRLLRATMRLSHHNVDTTVEVEEIKARRWLMPDPDFKVG